MLGLLGFDRQANAVDDRLTQVSRKLLDLDGIDAVFR
jgi:hypothetical protein